MRRSILLACVGVLALAGSASAADHDGRKKAADTDNLAAHWWQQVSSIPASASPYYDETKCGVGQQGKVWNLVSTVVPTETLGDPTEVNCTIPAHKEIFLALITQFCIAYPGETPEEQPDLCTTGLEAPILLRLVIDGKERDRFIERRTSSWFTMQIADENVYPGLPGGIYQSVADGYYALLPPLKPGYHEVIYQAGVQVGDQTVYFNTRHVLNIVEPADSIVPIEP